MLFVLFCFENCAVRQFVPFVNSHNAQAVYGDGVNSWVMQCYAVKRSELAWHGSAIPKMHDRSCSMRFLCFDDFLCAFLVLCQAWDDATKEPKEVFVRLQSQLSILEGQWKSYCWRLEKLPRSSPRDKEALPENRSRPGLQALTKSCHNATEYKTHTHTHTHQSWTFRQDAFLTGCRTKGPCTQANPGSLLHKQHACHWIANRSTGIPLHSDEVLRKALSWRMDVVTANHWVTF